MADGLRAWWRGLRHLNQRGYIYIWANVLWALLSLPLVTAPAAWAGLVRMSYRAHTRPTADVNDFWEGFKENLGRGAALALLNAVIILVNVTNISAYRSQSGLLVDVLRLVWVLALLIWFTVQFYLWPLFYEMKQPSLRGALRNAAVMFLLNPFFTLGLWLGIAAVLLLSTVLVAPWLLLTGGALAAIATSAVFDRLEAAGLRPRIPEVVETAGLGEE